MNRQPDPGFDPRIADWLEADPDNAPPEVLRTVESALPSIPQRRVLRLPWRTLPMNRPVLVLATVGLLAVLGIGAVTVGSRPSTTTPTPAPTVPAAVEASPSQAVGGDTLAAYVAARDDLCRSYSVTMEPLKARVSYLYDPAATEKGRDDAVDALRKITGVVNDMVADLLALDPPDDMRTAHVMDAARYDDIRILLLRELSLLNLGDTASAQAVDEATDAISAQINAFEVEYGLTGCP